MVWKCPVAWIRLDWPCLFDGARAERLGQRVCFGVLAVLTALWVLLSKFIVSSLSGSLFGPLFYLSALQSSQSCLRGIYWRELARAERFLPGSLPVSTPFVCVCGGGVWVCMGYLCARECRGICQCVSRTWDAFAWLYTPYPGPGTMLLAPALEFASLLSS